MDLYLSNVKLEHEKLDKLYPRPTFPCSGCQDELILCWGDKRSPYLRHANKMEAKCMSNGESNIHKIAKIIICDYLNDGHRLEVKRTCHTCQNTSFFVVPIENLKYFPEVQYKSSRFDVAGINSINHIEFGMEIKHTHSTTNDADRNDFNWSEFSANHVITMYLEGWINVILDDLRELNCKTCSDRIKEVHSIYKLFGIPDECTRTDTGENQENSETYISPSEGKLNTIARTLGYLQTYIPYKYNSSRMIDIAILGKYETEVEYWTCNNIEPFDGPEKRLHYSSRKELVEIGRCLKCSQYHDVKQYKPFCMKCFRKISQIDEIVIEENPVCDDCPIPKDQKKWIYVSNDIKIYLLGKIQWLNDIKNQDDSVCSICKGLKDPCCRQYTNYFYERKGICEFCVYTKMKSDGVVI